MFCVMLVYKLQQERAYAREDVSLCNDFVVTDATDKLEVCDDANLDLQEWLRYPARTRYSDVRRANFPNKENLSIHQYSSLVNNTSTLHH